MDYAVIKEHELGVYDETELLEMVCDYARVVAHVLMTSRGDVYAVDENGDLVVQVDGAEPWVGATRHYASRYAALVEDAPGDLCFNGYDLTLLDEVGRRLIEGAPDLANV